MPRSAEAGRNRFHRRMGHAGAGPVREHVTRAGLRRPHHQPGNRLTGPDLNSERFRLRLLSCDLSDTLLHDRDFILEKSRREITRADDRPGLRNRIYGQTSERHYKMASY